MTSASGSIDFDMVPGGADTYLIPHGIGEVPNYASVGIKGGTIVDSVVQSTGAPTSDGHSALAYGTDADDTNIIIVFAASISQPISFYWRVEGA